MAERLLEMEGVTKHFPGVVALDHARLSLHAGEVHCLVGENGAGKSTLMKILAGAESLDSGTIHLGDDPIDIQSPHHAQQLGISMIYQEFNLSPYLSIAENICLGREPRLGRTPFLDWRAMRQNAEALLRRIGMELDVRTAIRECSVAQQQMVEIAKALAFKARIIIMDEPSATLTDHELETLFGLIRELRQQGMGLIYISHRLDEIFEIGDRVTIMRDGQHIATQPVGEISKTDIIRMMVGRELKDEYPKEDFERGPAGLRVEGLTRDGVFDDVSFELHSGEIVGLTGLVGAGRTEVARAIFGADPLDRGQIYFENRPLSLRSPRDAIAEGIGLLTEDRKHQGLILGMTLRENTALANLKEVVRNGFVDAKKERGVAEKYVEELNIRTPSIEQAVEKLSGGNQQKVVLAKWLFTQSRVLLFDEPTRGIDVGAKVEIYRLINSLVKEGVCVLLISSELEEILGMCDRILVMHEGRIAGELAHSEATQEAIMHLATGSG